MQITLLCQTKPRPSYTIPERFTHQEYALGTDLTETEKQNIYDLYRINAVFCQNATLTLRRYVYNDNGTITRSEWDLMDVVNDPRLAPSYFGDSEYWNGESLSPLFEVAKIKREKENAINHKIRELEARITPLSRFSYVSPLYQEYDAQYTAALKEKRLYTKAQRGKVDPEVLASIREPISSTYLAEKKRIETQIKTLTEELNAL